MCWSVSPKTQEGIAADTGNKKKSTAWHRDKLSLLLSFHPKFQMQAHWAREAAGRVIPQGSAALG